MSDLETKELGNGWTQFISQDILDMNRNGWAGLADRLVSWWTGKPQRQIRIVIRLDACARGGTVELWRVQTILGRQGLQTETTVWV